MNDLVIIKITPKPYMCNVYILESDGRYIVIDTTKENIGIDFTKIDYVILTHEHYDHISGVNYFHEKSNAKIICSSVCGVNIQNSNINFSAIFRETFQIRTSEGVSSEIQSINYTCTADITFKNDFYLHWQGHELYLFETPGHSAGSICIIVDNKYLFCGDSLFKDYATATRLPGGSTKAWKYVSFPNINTLSKDLIVYPGHSDDFVLRDYKFWNAYK